jgi:ferritin-like protein
MEIRVLSLRVLVVAEKGSIDDWTAYIDAVPGKNHAQEAEEVLRNGTKIPYWMAKQFFPLMDKKYTWRP